MKKCLLLIVAITGLAALAGCANDGTAAASAPAASVPPAKPAPAAVVKDAELLIPADKVNAIAQGMNGATVRRLLGEPNKVVPFTKGNISGQIWSYRVAVSEVVNQVATSMRDVPAWDPIGNRAITVKEPVFQQEHVRTYTTLELLMVDDRLIERKPGHEIDRAFY